MARIERQFAGRTLAIETGRMARQADGSCTVQFGDTMVLATCVSSNPREGIDFFPLTIDVEELSGRQLVFEPVSDDEVEISDVAVLYASAAPRRLPRRRGLVVEGRRAGRCTCGADRAGRCRCRRRR